MEGGGTETDAPPAIRVAHLGHTYPAMRRRGRGRSHAHRGPALLEVGLDRPALDDVTFDVRAGEIFGILGPNGGGKTTLFRVLSTMLRPSTGQVEVFGHDVVAEPHAVRTLLGVVFQHPSLDGKLTARENLLHQGHLYGLRGPALHQRSEELLTYFALADRQDQYVEHFSGGMRRRVEVAKALLHQPRLLLLDEPSTGLDPGARLDLWRHLQTLRAQQGMTVALTTHLMDEADRCDRLAILTRGRLVALDTPANLKARIGGDVVTIEPPLASGSPGTADQSATEELARLLAQAFGPWGEGAAPVVIDGKIRLEKPDGPAFVAQLASALPGQMRSITVGQPTLDDVFMHLTGHALDDEAAGVQ